MEDPKRGESDAVEDDVVEDDVEDLEVEAGEGQDVIGGWGGPVIGGPPQPGG